MKALPVALCLLLCLLLSACGSLSAPKKDMFYRLGTSAPSAAPNDGAAAFYVPPFGASGLHGERALVYAHADGTSLEQYNYHFWMDSPRILLQEALVDALRGGMAARVTREPADGAARTVRGRIRRFERAGPDGQATAELALEFELLRERGAEPEFTRTYARSTKLSADTPAACAAALAAASHEVMAQFVEELRAHLAQ